MYDPTIFDNLKVAFENRIYDLDNITQDITITNRADRMDFATMARELSIQFSLVDDPDVKAEVVLAASVDDLAGEIMEMPGVNPGCSLLLRFFKRVHNVSTQCEQIEKALSVIWENDTELTQTLSYPHGKSEVASYLNKIEVKFKPKLDEEHIHEIPEFLEHVLDTLESLADI